ncbi:hypothetical protein LWI29_023738 [Acer saccharum]|uniref:Protein kinase domain-containing protein n=1 Tax=Acer saccharum TaxID=4024 RepID=A0AA39T795_ACESA|nr:hypothetical protein LWI29_023738 [Acer saccharum]
METSSGSEENHIHKHHFHHSSSQNMQPDHHHDGILSFNSIVIIIVSIITIIVLLAIFLIIALLRRLKSSKANKTSCKDIQIGSSRFIAHTTINFTSSPDVKGGGCLYGSHSRSNNNKGGQVFTYKELELATDKFSEANVMSNIGGIGGGFGVVYRGVLSSDGTLAAIKKIHRDRKQGERAFRMEVDLLSHLHSPYLVELLGYCADQNHRLLVYEYMPNGTLNHHLHLHLHLSDSSSNRYQPLDWGTRLVIALDCARALEFLHEHAVPSVIHRDFKCSNVLLDHNFRAKVTGFGLAKTVSDKINGQISTRVLGTTGYLAPEYASTGKLTTKSDVYSYGVVLLELLTGRVPIDSNRPSGEHVLVSWALPRLTSRQKVVEMVDPCIQGQYSKKDLIQVAAIAAMCVQPEADYRPLMTDVVQSLIPLVKNSNTCSSISSGSTRFQHQTPSPRYERPLWNCTKSYDTEESILHCHSEQ